jgi:hypothetical protein
VRATRSKSRHSKRTEELEWEDVIPTLQYSFAARGIELCRKIKAGEPKRRRSGNIRPNFDGFKGINLNFRRKYINVYIWGDFENASEFLQSKFRDEVNINSWKNGYSIVVETEKQFEDLVKWLQLE